MLAPKFPKPLKTDSAIFRRQSRKNYKTRLNLIPNAVYRIPEYMHDNRESVSVRLKITTILINVNIYQ